MRYEGLGGNSKPGGRLLFAQEPETKPGTSEAMLASQPKGDDGDGVVAELDLTAGAGEAAGEEDETRKKVSLFRRATTTGGRLQRIASPGTHLQILPWPKSRS